MGWFYVITEEMRALDLKGNELIVFAILQGYSQKGDGCYYGGQTLLAERAGVAQRTLRDVLKSLEEKGLVKEFPLLRDSHNVTAYTTTPPAEIAAYQPAEIAGGDRQNLPVASGRICRSIKVNIENKDIKEKNISIPPYPPTKSSAFSLRSALIAAGVSADVADAWLAVRKAKRAVNTEVAWRAIEREISRSGRSANDCIRFAAERSWAGFKAEWLNEESTKRPTPAAPSHAKGDYVLNGMRILDSLQGTNYYGEYMAAKNGTTLKRDIDEQ